MKFKLAILVAALTLGSTAFAADKKQSISVFGNITIPEDGGNQGTVFLSFGHLFGDSWEFEGSIAQTYSSAGGSDITFSTLGIGGKYYFKPVGGAGKVLPYAKVGLSASRSNAPSPDYSSYLGGGGIEFAMNESASTFIEAVYSKDKYDTMRSGNITIGGNTTSSIVFNVGVKLRF